MCVSVDQKRMTTDEEKTQYSTARKKRVMRLPFVLAYLLRWCATLLLYALGWTPINRKDIKCHFLIKKGVIVYNHTTAWEFGLTLLYGLSCPEPVSYTHLRAHET